MKTIVISILAAFLSSAMLTSCGSNKKMQASKAPVKNPKPDSIEIIREPSKTASTPKTIDKEAATPLPPNYIEDKFSGEHKLATNISWAKEPVTNESGNPNHYQAAYEENGKKNWVTYTESGIVVEERHEILTDQLPQNIYNSIKEKYPDFKIISAATYKHLKQDGSYAVVIRPATGAEQKELELIVRENGTFVQ